MTEIEAGTLLLNEQVGCIWPHMIDLDSLNLQSCTHCMLGQLFGSFEKGCEALGLTELMDPCYYGFNIDPHMVGDIVAEYYYMTQLWKEHIREMRGENNERAF